MNVDDTQPIRVVESPTIVEQAPARHALRTVPVGPAVRHWIIAAILVVALLGGLFWDRVVMVWDWLQLWTAMAAWILAINVGSWLGIV